MALKREYFPRNLAITSLDQKDVYIEYLRRELINLEFLV